MKVWLTRKHAERIDGVNLRGYDVGDTLELSPVEARLLIAEEWAKPERRKRTLRTRQRRRASDSR
jgi:hypothetical protein